MKQFIDKLEEKIKVTSLEIIVTGTKDKPYFEIKYKEIGKEHYNIGYSSYDLNNVFDWKEECFEIVNQLAEEYKDKVIIDGQYCFQTCSATEHCKECNRLCNGSIDYYENYDCLAEEYNNESVKGDLISKSALMEALGKSDRDARTDADIQGYCDGWNDVVEIINEQPTTNNNGWIPCSERLPEGKESHKVLVTDEDRIMAVCYFLEVTKIFKVCWDGEEFQGVVAWQPLPEPFKPKGE